MYTEIFYYIFVQLQQLENDLEDLKYLRDNSKFATKELEEKLKQEQSTIVKQCDAISDLEQTIKTLQEKYSSSERSVLIDVDDKENISLSGKFYNINTRSLSYYYKLFFFYSVHNKGIYWRKK